jgi:release factor glutamine methyltransferase
MATIFALRKKYLQTIPSLDADLLLAHATKKPKEFVFTHPEYKLSLSQTLRFFYVLFEYRHGWSIAYITHHKEFFGLDFYVDRQVLVPRPDTEILVEEVLKTLPPTNIPITLVDIGTGSGCIPIAIMKTFKNKNIKAIATDISADALKIAQKNARIYNVSIEFLHGNLLEPVMKLFESFPENHQLVITANLPYLTNEQFRDEPSIKYEPYQALVADENGLKLYRLLLEQLKTTNQPFTAFFEFDSRQTEQLTKLTNTTLPSAKISIKKDLALRDRLAVIHLN